MRIFLQFAYLQSNVLLTFFSSFHRKIPVFGCNFEILKVYTIRLQRNRDYNIRFCGDDSIPENYINKESYEILRFLDKITSYFLDKLLCRTPSTFTSTRGSKRGEGRGGENKKHKKWST